MRPNPVVLPYSDGSCCNLFKTSKKSNVNSHIFVSIKFKISCFEQASLLGQNQRNSCYSSKILTWMHESRTHGKKRHTNTYHNEGLDQDSNPHVLGIIFLDYLQRKQKQKIVKTKPQHNNGTYWVCCNIYLSLFEYFAQNCSKSVM